MTTSKHELTEDDLILLDRIQSLMEKTSKSFETTLGDTRKASSVRIAGLTHEMEEFKANFAELKSAFYSFRTSLTTDDPNKDDPTSIFGKVRVLWKKHKAEEENRAKWTGRDWINLAHGIIQWGAIGALGFIAAEMIAKMQ